MEQPGAWTVLRSTLPASCLPALVYCWELCFEQLKKNTIHADIARGTGCCWRGRKLVISSWMLRHP